MDDVEDVIPGLRVDPDGRFVHDEELGFMHQGAPDVDPPLHPSGKRLDGIVLPFG